MHKLNMWQRLGLVLSIIWIGAGGFLQRSVDVSTADEASSVSLEACHMLADDEPTNYTPQACQTNADRIRRDDMAGSLVRVASLAFLPVLCGWILAYVLMWIWAGRRNSN